MSTIAVQSQYPMFFDASGLPLNSGYIYFGKINTNPAIASNQIPVYWDSGFTQPVAQPIRTANGSIYRSGTPANIYTKENFSISVYDKLNRLIAYFPVGNQVLSGANGSENIGFIQPSPYAVPRTLQDKVRESVSVKDFGAKGNFDSDDTGFIQLADDWCSSNGVSLLFPRGVYRCTNGIDKRAYWIGEGVSKIGVFPIFDDKVNLVPGQKANLPGSVLLFTGTGTKIATTARADQFSSMRYAVRNIGRENADGSPIARGGENFSIIADFNFRNSVGGPLTLPGGDAQAEFDVGLLKWNSEQAPFHNVTVGGYWKKCGTVHYGRDPDNAHVQEFRTMGNIGLAIIGDGTGTNSGYNAYGSVFSANDHHSRTVGIGEQWGDCAVFIDIPSPSGGGSVNGISFHGGTVATKVNTPVKYGRCGVINWFGTVFENANESGSPAAGGPKRQNGTADTGDVNFFGCRIDAAAQLLGSGGLIDTAGGTIRIAGDSTGAGYQYWKGGAGVRISGTAAQVNIQLTADKSTSTSGTVFRHTSSDGVTRILNANTEVATLDAGGTRRQPLAVAVINVVGGVATTTRKRNRLSGGTQDLVTLNGGVDGEIVILTRNTSADVITLRDLIGNLRLNGDFTLGSFGSIELMFDNGLWVEQRRFSRP